MSRASQDVRSIFTRRVGKRDSEYTLANAETTKGNGKVYVLPPQDGNERRPKKSALIAMSGPSRQSPSRQWDDSGPSTARSLTSVPLTLQTVEKPPTSTTAHTNPPEKKQYSSMRIGCASCQGGRRPSSGKSYTAQGRISNNNVNK